MASDSRAHSRGARVGEWIRLARAGSAEALGRLLETLRPYLLLVANEELPAWLRGKVGASDLVQETCLQAQGHFDRFRDDGEAELLAWLRRILLNNVATLQRRYSADKRQVAREVPLAECGADGLLDLPLPGPSPSSFAAARERDAALLRALERLPEEYRQVVHWRSYGRLPFDEVGRRMGRSAEAARKLWVRAIERLQQGLDGCDES